MGGPTNRRGEAETVVLLDAPARRSSTVTKSPSTTSYPRVAVVVHYQPTYILLLPAVIGELAMPGYLVDLC